MFELIDRREEKRRAAEIVRTASVSAMSMTALYMGLNIILNVIDSYSGGGIPGTFVSILTGLLGSVLGAGFVLYCMAIRRGERAEYLTLFDGFPFVGKLIALELVIYLFIFLWSLLFVIPGIIAAYRYSFAMYNLYENPTIGVMEALNMSKRQTMGYKSQLFLLDLSYLGWSLLAALPAIVVSVLCYRQYFLFLDTLTAGGILNLNIDPASYLGMPVWAWAVLQSLWGLVVSMFYLPNRICVLLAYFETAKHTSGVPGEGRPSWGDDWNNDPDGLGRF